ncbi:MAG: hypothetical protein HYX55_03895 [Chloroflexi bacterium]|nr:hypothetical protein [Chloroflexota bacterium]
MDSLHAVAAAQEALRTVVDRDWRLRVLTSPDLRFDLRLLPAESDGLLEMEQHLSLDVFGEGVLLWHTRFLMRDDKVAGISFSFDHLVADGASLPNFLNQLTEAMFGRAVARGHYYQASHQPEIAPDVDALRADLLFGSTADTLPQLEIAGDVTRSPGVWRERWPAPSTHALLALARRCGATPYVVLLAGWLRQVARRHAGNRLLVNVPMANRSAADAATVGWFANTVPIVVVRDRLSGSLPDAVETITSALAAGSTRAGLAFSQVVALVGQRYDSGIGLQMTYFDFDSRPRRSILWPLATLRRIDPAQDPTPVPGFSTWFRFEDDDGLTCVIAYDADNVDAGVVRKMLRDMTQEVLS